MTTRKALILPAVAGLAILGLLVAILVVSSTKPVSKNVVATVLVKSLPGENEPAPPEPTSPPVRRGAAVLTQGQTVQAPDTCTTTGSTCTAYPTVPAQVASAPTDWGSRVRMKGCGRSYSITVNAGGKTLLVNDGTVTRTVYSSDPPAKTLVPTDWTEITWAHPAVATAYKIRYATSTCYKPVANTVSVLVNPA